MWSSLCKDQKLIFRYNSLLLFDDHLTNAQSRKCLTNAHTFSKFRPAEQKRKEKS